MKQKAGYPYSYCDSTLVHFSIKYFMISFTALLSDCKNHIKKNRKFSPAYFFCII